MCVCLCVRTTTSGLNYFDFADIAHASTPPRRALRCSRAATSSSLGLGANMTSSVKPGVHNVSLRRQMRIKPQPQVACTKFGEDLTCSSEDMIVDRQTRRQTRHSDTLITILRSAWTQRSKNNEKLQHSRMRFSARELYECLFVDDIHGSVGNHIFAGQNSELPEWLTCYITGIQCCSPTNKCAYNDSRDSRGGH